MQNNATATTATTDRSAITGTAIVDFHNLPTGATAVPLADATAYPQNDFEKNAQETSFFLRALTEDGKMLGVVVGFAGVCEGVILPADLPGLIVGLSALK